MPFTKGDYYVQWFNHTAKLRIFSGLSKKYLKTLDGEDADVAYAADFAGGEQLDVAPTAVVVVTEGDAVVKM